MTTNASAVAATRLVPRLASAPGFAKKSIRLLVITLLLPWSGIALQAATSAPTEAIDPRAGTLKEEHWDRGAPAASGRIKGFTANTGMPANLSAIYLVADPTNVTSVCVQVGSIDARYRVEAAFDLSGEADVHLLRLPARYRHQIEAYPAEEVALVAFPAANCDEQPTALVPAAWSEPPRNRSSYILQVNSINKDLRVRVNDKWHLCGGYSGSNTKAFDRVCHFELDTSTTVELIYQRFHFEQAIEDGTLVVLVP